MIFCSPRIFLSLAYFTVALDFTYGYTVFFREHNSESDNFQTHDVVDPNPDVCYEVTSKHPIPDIEGVGLINGPEAGIIVQELSGINIPGYEAQTPENLLAIGLYQGLENFDCIGFPDAVIRFHDPQGEHRTSVQYVDFGKTDPPLAGRYRFWKPIVPDDTDWRALFLPDSGAGYVRIKTGRFKRPAYTDMNGDLLVSWQEFNNYMEAWVYLAGLADGIEAADYQVQPSVNLPASNLAENPPQDYFQAPNPNNAADGGLGRDSSNIPYQAQPNEGGVDDINVKEEEQSEPQVKMEEEEIVKAEEESPFRFNVPRRDAALEIQPNSEPNRALWLPIPQAPSTQAETNNLNYEESISHFPQPQQRNPYVRTAAEVGTQTEPQAPQLRIYPEGTRPNLPARDPLYVPEANRPLVRVTGFRPVNEVVNMLQQRTEPVQDIIQNYLATVARPDTASRTAAQEMINRLPYEPGTTQYEMEVTRILAEMEEAQIRALRRRIYQPLSDPSLDHITARNLVEIGNMYLLWEQQDRQIELTLLSRNLDNIEPMDSRIAHSLSAQDVRALSADDTIRFYLATDPSRLDELRAMQQALQAQGLQAQQAQAEAQGLQGNQGQGVEEEEEEEDDNLFADYTRPQ
ncbi:hypothetical protein TWF481_009040 [Arthrobotrys musiformis]|uniref:Uncharacterized protein n=1 Tax=Arthrobotrys musiformis TaxID=47236 RepID=A0AAV9W8B4_9PEZI